MFHKLLLSLVKICFLLIIAGTVWAADDPVPEVRGVMAFGWGANFQDTKALSLPYIDGMTAYFAWQDLQPKEQSFDFSKIDTLLEIAEKNNKRLNIGIYPGSHTPKWVYEKEVKRFKWVRRLKEDQARRRGALQEQDSPYPWDPIYLKIWKEFITELITRYNNHINIGYISLTGPTIRDLSTGILLKEEDDWKRFQNGVDVKKLLVSSWIEIIEHYQSIDRKQRYAIALGPMRPANPDITVAADILHYIRESRYTNIAIMSVFLNDTWFESGLAARRIRKLLREGKEDGFNIGYQMAQSVERNRTWNKQTPIVRNLSAALQLGLNDGMDWVEIWHDDIIDRKSNDVNVKYKETLKKFHGELSP